MDTLSEQKQTILVVDDTPENLALIFELLDPYYKVKVANSGEKALQQLTRTELPDLILLDIMMPGIDGYEVLTEIKKRPDSDALPVIFLTAMSRNEDEERGLRLGAVDYITKPISPPLLLARVKTHLQLKSQSDLLRHQNVFLDNEVKLRTAEVTAIQDVTILAMASLAETRDNETGNHIRRTQHYVKTLALHLRHHPRFSNYLTDKQIDILFKSAPLHDIGKVGIPDRILLKPGKFEPAEFEIMKTHTQLGYNAIAHAEQQLGTPVEFLSCAKEIALSHQEKWDGSGYPSALAGDNIPISARLMAVADVYDALISRRVYKDGMPHEKAVAIIREGHGKHFDPDIADAFLSIHQDFHAIAIRFSDSDQELQDKADTLEKFAPPTGN